MLSAPTAAPGALPKQITPTLPVTVTTSDVNLSASLEAPAENKKEESPRLNLIPVVTLDYYTAFRNYQIIQLLDKIKCDQDRNIDRSYPPVALIRGRQLFVIRPSSWKGLDFFRQIWYIVNRIFLRYKGVDPDSITSEYPYKPTLHTVATPEYKDWLGISALEKQIADLKKAQKETQIALDNEKEASRKQLKEIEELKKPQNPDDDPAKLKALIERLRTEVMNLTSMNQSRNETIKLMKEMPDPGTQLAYQTIIDKLIKLVNESRIHLNKVSRTLNDVEAAKIAFKKDADALLKQLSDDFFERKKVDPTSTITALISEISAKIGAWLPGNQSQFLGGP